jgi:hypothetical protein
VAVFRIDFLITDYNFLPDIFNELSDVGGGVDASSSSGTGAGTGSAIAGPSLRHNVENDAQVRLINIILEIQDEYEGDMDTTDSLMLCQALDTLQNESDMNSNATIMARNFAAAMKGKYKERRVEQEKKDAELAKQLLEQTDTKEPGDLCSCCMCALTLFLIRR